MMTVQHNLAALDKALAAYSRATGKTAGDVLQKQAPKLGFNLRQEFKGLMPGKGTIRSERLDALKRGEGVHVRPSVYKRIGEKYNALGISGRMLFRTRRRIAGGQEELGELRGTITRKGGKRLNLQALAVERELNLRESGRGFMRQSAAFIGALATDIKARSRYNRTLAEMGFRIEGTGPEARLVWGGFSALSNDAVKAIMRTKGQSAVARALSATTADIQVYLDRKMAEQLRKVHAQFAQTANALIGVAQV